MKGYVTLEEGVANKLRNKCTEIVEYINAMKEEKNFTTTMFTKKTRYSDHVVMRSAGVAAYKLDILLSVGGTVCVDDTIASHIPTILNWEG